MTDKRSWWSDDVIADLDRLWRANELSTREIGKWLSEKYRRTISGHAIIGKAHRLGLPPKPDPVKAHDAVRPREWPDEARDRLRALWLAGKQTSDQIAATLKAEFGVTIKGKSVCERAKVMGLPDRSGFRVVRPPVVKVKVKAVDPMAREPDDHKQGVSSFIRERHNGVLDKAARATRRETMPLDGGTRTPFSRSGTSEQRAIDKITPSHVATFTPVLPRHPCRYIEGDVVRGRPTIYCDAPSEPGKDWCPKHYALCYTPRVKVFAGQTLGPAP